MQGREQAEWIQRLEADIDNLRAAMSLALEGGVDPFIAVKMAVALQHFWILRGYATEGRKLVRAALSTARDPDRRISPRPGRSMSARAWPRARAITLRRARCWRRCLALRRRLGNPRRHCGDAVDAVARSAADRRCGRAEVGEREALQIFRELGDRRGEAIGLLHLGQIASISGDDAQAQMHLEQCLAIAREIKHQEIEGECELVLGEVAFEAGDRMRRPDCGSSAR